MSDRILITNDNYKQTVSDFIQIVLGDSSISSDKKLEVALDFLKHQLAGVSVYMPDDENVNSGGKSAVNNSLLMEQFSKSDISVYSIDTRNRILKSKMEDDNIISILSIPLKKDNAFYGFIAVEFDYNFELSEAVSLFLERVRDFITFYIESKNISLKNSLTENIYRAVTTLSTDCIFFFNHKGICVDYKPFKGERTTPESVKNRTVDELFNNETAFLIKNYIGRAGRTGTPVYFNYDAENHGEVRSYNAKMTALKSDTVIMIVHDATDEISYKQKDKFITHVVDNIYDGVIAFDFYFRIRYANYAALSQYGYTAKEITSKNFVDLLPTEDFERIRSEIISSVSLNGIWNGNVSGKRKDGTFFISELKITPLYQTDGDSSAYVCVERDITESKQAEIDLIWAKEAAEAGNKAKSEFLANMSHEIRTPLNSIIGFTQVLIEEEDDEETKNMLKIINTSGNNLLGIINDILDLSKIESGKLNLIEKNIDLRDFINNLRRRFQHAANEKGLYFHIKVEKSFPEKALLDDLRLFQVMNNLLCNAFKFTNEGGVVLRCFTKGNFICFSVTDTGVGIDNSKISDIFKPFYQTDASITREFGGTGLGLTITKKLLHLMGGEIFVESNIDIGTTFTVSIPGKVNCSIGGFNKSDKDGECMVKNWIDKCGDDKELVQIVKEGILNYINLSYELTSCFNENKVDRMKEIIHEIKGFSGNCGMTEVYDIFVRLDDEIRKDNYDSCIVDLYIKESSKIVSTIPDLSEPSYDDGVLKILMADDNFINQKLIAALLKNMSVECEFANNGKEALEKLRIKNYDMLLLDMQMPIMDGEELLRIIRSDNKLKDIYVIIFTAHAISGDEERFINMGGDDYLSKPLDKEIFRSKIKQRMEKLKEAH